jgi:hypothetical protein
VRYLLCIISNIQIIWIRIRFSWFASLRTIFQTFTGLVSQNAFYCVGYRGGRIRPDPRNPSDPSGTEPDSIWFFKKVNLTRPDPNPTRPDPTRPEIKWPSIQSKSINDLKKTQHINWPDPIRPGPARFLLEGQTDPTRPTRIRTRLDPPDCHL